MIFGYFRTEPIASSEKQDNHPQRSPSSSNNNINNPTNGQPLKDSNGNTIPGKGTPAVLTTVERSPSHHQQYQQLHRNSTSTPPSTTSTTTSLDLEHLIRKSEICSSPRHSNCEHSGGSSKSTTGSPRQKEISSRPNVVGGFQPSSNSAPSSSAGGGAGELKKVQGKPHNSSSSNSGTPTGGSLKRIAPAPGGGSSAKGGERPLQCLETLAQKAGITFEDKYEVAPHNNFKMEKTQSPAQQQQAQAVQQQQQAQQQQQQQQQPLQISQEQFQQLQQLQQFQGFGGNMVQVKQEFPQQQNSGSGQQGNTIQITGRENGVDSRGQQTYLLV